MAEGSKQILQNIKHCLNKQINSHTNCMTIDQYSILADMNKKQHLLQVIAAVWA
jgi:hypothetical protein